MKALCKYARATTEKCGCVSNEPLVECANGARNAALDERFDCARNHAKRRDGRVYLRARFCDWFNCVDFEPTEETNDCRFATRTDRKWGAGKCVVVECRSKDALDSGSTLSFTDAQGRAFDVCAYRAREGDFLPVRSRFCNKQSCQFYERKS